jgi:hypothetical protein
MIDERLYIVSYDISNERRWRRVFKLMRGYGQWLQLSVFQCRLTGRRRAELARRRQSQIRALPGIFRGSAAAASLKQGGRHDGTYPRELF